LKNIIKYDVILYSEMNDDNIDFSIYG